MGRRFGDVSDRIDMFGLLPDTKSHLAAYNRVDIALDSFPYAGTTTTCEAIFMGVPVVTLSSEEGPHAQNVGASLLSALGLTECIATSASEFVDVAKRLANDSSRITELRQSLRAQMLASPLCDAKGYVEAFEDAVEKMFDEWAEEGEPSLPKEEGKATVSDKSAEDVELPSKEMGG